MKRLSVAVKENRCKEVERKMGGGHREKGQRRRKCDGERKMERGSGIKSGQSSELNDQDQIS